MKRYMLFGSEDIYYAYGGVSDLVSMEDDVDILLDYAIRNSREDTLTEEGSYLDWWHIWDTKGNCVVYASQYQAYGVDSEDFEEKVTKGVLCHSEDGYPSHLLMAEDGSFKII